LLTLADLPGPFVTAVAVALGLAFGSFLNVVIYRLPRGESLSHPGSRCPGCGKPIRAFDNIPVLGWLMLAGRARCCKIWISPRYPLVEALGGLLAWAIVRAIIFELPEQTAWWKVVLLFALYLALALGLLAAAFIDLDRMYLPDQITIGGAILGISSVPLRSETFADAFLGAAIGFVIVWLPFDFLYSKLRGLPGMGLGDAKLVARRALRIVGRRGTSHCHGAGGVPRPWQNRRTRCGRPRAKGTAGPARKQRGRSARRARTRDCT
jgi:leader peptidase (prepilin peptidase)/N-methyltransferase